MSGDDGDSSGYDDMPHLLDEKSDGEGGLSDDGNPRAAASRKPTRPKTQSSNASQSRAPAPPAQEEVPDPHQAEADRLGMLAQHRIEGILAGATQTEDTEVVKKALEAGKDLECAPRCSHSPRTPLCRPAPHANVPPRQRRPADQLARARRLLQEPDQALPSATESKGARDSAEPAPDAGAANVDRA